MLRSFGRRTLALVLGLIVLMCAVVILAPALVDDPRALPMVSHGRSILLSNFFLVFLVAFPLSFIAGLALLAFSPSTRRQEGFGGGWVWLATLSSFVIIPVGFFLLAVTSLAFVIAAPFSAERKVIALDGITLDDSHVARLTSAIRLDGNSRMAGNYLSSAIGVWDISEDIPSRFVSAKAGSLSDFFVRRTYLYAIVGKQLIAVDTKNYTTELISNLPFTGMRFGQIKRDFGGASNFLLLGRNAGTSYLYELRSGGEYAKLTDSDAELAGASSCIDRIYVATKTDVLQLRYGFKPIHLFRIPGDDQIKSILARQTSPEDRDACALLIATEGSVYSLQNGVATMLLSGLGGNLGALEEQDLDFTLVDPARNISVRVSYDVL